MSVAMRDLWRSGNEAASEFASHPAKSMKVPLVALMLTLVFMAQHAHASDNVLPAELQRVLHSGGRAVLYSLEPWSDPEEKVARLDGYKILGKSALSPAQQAVAVAAFDEAIAGFDGSLAACFDPRHAIRIPADGHTYDFLLCYSCHQLVVYRDGKSVGTVGVTGPSKKLDELLTSLHVPLSHSLEDMEAGQQAERRRIEEGERRWLSVLPTSIREVWDANAQFRIGLNPSGKALADLKAALQAEIPDRAERIRRLLVLFGSSAGPWSGYPGYEGISETLLLDYPTEEVIEVVQASKEDGAMLEGAARYLGGWDFRHRHAQDIVLIPAQLKARLLEHTLKSGDLQDEDRRDRAVRAFGNH